MRNYSFYSILSEGSSILNRWTEYCRNLYNYPIKPDVNILNHTEILSKDSDLNLTILKSEGKSPGIYNILS